MSNADERWVRLGVVGRPHGVKGAVKVNLDHKDGRTLRAGLRVMVGDVVRGIVTVSGDAVSFEGITDRDVAASLTHKELSVRRGDFGAGDYLVDLVGANVTDVAGTPLGTIKGFLTSGPQLLAEVQTAADVVLVPFVAPIVARLGPPVVLAPPPGLFDDDALVAGDAASADTTDAEVDGDDRA